MPWYQPGGRRAFLSMDPSKHTLTAGLKMVGLPQENGWCSIFGSYSLLLVVTKMLHQPNQTVVSSSPPRRRQQRRDAKAMAGHDGP